MKATFTILERKISVSAEYTGSKAAKWGGKNENWNHHRITIRHNNKSTSFDFWASIMCPTVEDERGLIGALYCFCNDAWSGESGFEDFCSEFGYDSDSRNAESIHKACLKANKALKRVLDMDDICDFCNEVSALENA